MTQTEPMTLVAVGSYTRAYGPFRAVGKGVALYRFRLDHGLLEPADEIGDLTNPAYLRWFGPTLLHAVLETDDAEAGIATIRVDPVRGATELVDRRQVEGSIPCHLDVDPSGRWLAVPCYGSGDIFVHRLEPDGRVGAAVSAARHIGSSVHSLRQLKAHPHCVRFSPDGRWLIVPDLGTDEVRCHPFDPRTGRLGAPARTWRAPAGSGPRIALFSRSGRNVVLVHELTSEVSSLKWNDGAFERVTTLRTLAADHAGLNTSAGLRWHPSGTMFAVSNRGADTLALFAFAPKTGDVRHLGTTASGGAKPRDFDFSHNGRWLIVGNQDGDTIVVHGVDQIAGRIVAEGQRCELGSPSCIRFAPTTATSY